MRPLTLKTALALGVGLATLGGLTAAHAQDAPAAPANGPGPATQPPPPPGTAQPAPTQPAAAPTPPGAVAAPGAPTPEAPAAPPPNYKLQYNGLIDGYYLFQFHNPKDSNTITGRAYDIRHNTPTLALAELNVFQNAPPKSFGYKATFITGDTADLNHFAFVAPDPVTGYTSLVHNDLGEGRFKNVQQLYGTYAFGADGSGVDFGKFYTPFGYEVTEANGDYNYSRSIAYNYVPFYHAGARIYTPVPGLAALTATFYLVQTLFNTATSGVQNNNKRPGYIGQLNYTDPKGKFTAISELGLGSQKFSSADIVATKVLVNDNNFTYNFTANQLAGLDYVYRSLKPKGGGKDTTNAYAVYYRQALTPKTAVALRYSGASDKLEDGLGASATARPYEVTATYEVKPAPNFTTRLEYRHDNSNIPGSFVGKDGTLTSKNQDTLTLAGMFTF